MCKNADTRLDIRGSFGHSNRALSYTGPFGVHLFCPGFNRVSMGFYSGDSLYTEVGRE